MVGALALMSAPWPTPSNFLKSQTYVISVGKGRHLKSETYVISVGKVHRLDQWRRKREKLEPPGQLASNFEGLVPRPLSVILTVERVSSPKYSRTRGEPKGPSTCKLKPARVPILPAARNVARMLSEEGLNLAFCRHNQ